MLRRIGVALLCREPVQPPRLGQVLRPTFAVQVHVAETGLRLGSSACVPDEWARRRRCGVRVSLGGLVRVVCSAWRSSLWVDAAAPEGGVAKEGRASGASRTGVWGNRRVAFSRCAAAGAGALTNGADQCTLAGASRRLRHWAGSRSRAQSRARAGRAVAATMGAPLGGRVAHMRPKTRPPPKACQHGAVAEGG